MLILASASPRRRDLLDQIHLAHAAVPAHIDETRRTGELPTDYVRRLALEKARAVHERHPDATVLGADTTVVLEGEVLNKPVDHADAERMLRSLAGRTHQVHTGIAVIAGTTEHSHVETTAVTMTPMHEDDLAAYLATGDSLDKAGAYGIQGFAGRWVCRVEGDFFNVVGLPLAATVTLLRKAESAEGAAPGTAEPS